MQSAMIMGLGYAKWSSGAVAVTLTVALRPPRCSLVEMPVKPWHCRFDHPATDCTVMGAEIDRRLQSG